MDFLKITNEDLNKMTIKQLKDIYKENHVNIKSKSNKLSIIQGIKEYIDALNQIKTYIENNYDTTEIIHHPFKGLVFNLITTYRNVLIEIRRDYNFKSSNAIWMSMKFKNPRRQRRGYTSGYCIQVSSYNIIDKEFKKILENIKEDGTWCDESYYDD